MTLKSLERYRKMHAAPEGYPWVRAMMDEIEAEVDERYLELPVDADGVPIHVGDRIEGLRHPIDEISFAATGITLDNCEGEHITLHMLETDLHHVKPDAVKELLEEFAHKAVRVGSTEAIPANIRMYANEDDIDEYAERIRKAVGE